MHAIQLGPEAQTPNSALSAMLRPLSFGGGELLGNQKIQVPSAGGPTALITSAPRTPLTRLEELKRRRFPPAGKEERVARALAALHQPGAIQLSAEDWRWFDENADSEEDLD